MAGLELPRRKLQETLLALSEAHSKRSLQSGQIRSFLRRHEQDTGKDSVVEGWLMELFDKRKEKRDLNMETDR